MFCLGYISFATDILRRADLTKLAAQSARDNQRLGITGVLLFDDGIFLQFLEGEETAVRTLLAKITQDPRHTRLSVVVEAPIAERHFPGWHMALANADDFPADSRAVIRQLGDHPPALPASAVSPTIERLIGTFQKVTKFGYSDYIGTAP